MRGSRVLWTPNRRVKAGCVRESDGEATSVQQTNRRHVLLVHIGEDVRDTEALCKDTSYGVATVTVPALVGSHDNEQLCGPVGQVLDNHGSERRAAVIGKHPSAYVGRVSRVLRDSGNEPGSAEFATRVLIVLKPITDDALVCGAQHSKDEMLGHDRFSKHGVHGAIGSPRQMAAASSGVHRWPQYARSPGRGGRG